jgi:hypothetical protein
MPFVFFWGSADGIGNDINRGFGVRFSVVPNIAIYLLDSALVLGREVACLPERRKAY